MFRPILVIVSLLFAVPVFGQSVVSSKIVDASTGEALAWVHVITDQKDGTVTNTDGEFELKINTQQTINISSMGYESVSFSVSNVPSLIKLHPKSYRLSEVRVTPKDAKTLIGELYEKYIHWVTVDSLQEKATYFYRQTTRNDGKINEILEAFFNSSSSIMLNGFNLCYGRYASTDFDVTHKNFFSFSAITPLGKVGKDGALWTSFITMDYEKYFNVDLKSVYMDHRDVYILTFSEKKRNKKPIIVGKLYVDGYSLLPIRFEGEILHFKYRVWGVANKQKPSFTITYSSDNEKVRVESVSFSDSYNYIGSLRAKIDVSSIMYRVNMNLPSANNQPIGTSDFLYGAIKSLPYDSTFWAQYPIIKRTDKEIQAIDQFSDEFIENSASKKQKKK